MQECRVCGESKAHDQFYRDGLKFRRECKECTKAARRRYAQANKEKLSAAAKEYHARNREARNKRSSAYYQANRDKCLESVKAYQQKNKEKRRESHREYERKRLKSDPVYACQKRVRWMVRESFRRFGYAKHGKTEQVMGCSWEIFVEHMRRQFTAGMTMDDLISGSIHIDHIIPLSSAKTVDDVIKLSHYTNLRPLWAKDNIAKGAKIENLI